MSKKEVKTLELTPKQMKFVNIFIEKGTIQSARQCALDAGFAESGATVIASQLQNPKYYPLVVKHIGELREENYKKHNISFGGHLTELAKIRDEALKSKSYSAATNAEKARGAVGGLYIEQKIIRTGKIEDLSEDELNERINTIVTDNSLLLDKKEETKSPQDKKPKLPLS